MPKGQKFGGRKKGTPNKTTGRLRTAILAAAEETGLEFVEENLARIVESGNADAIEVARVIAAQESEDGLKAYLKNLARIDPKAYASLLAKILPTEVTADPDAPVEIVFRTVYEEKPE